MLWHVQFGTFKAELGGQFKKSNVVPDRYSTFGRETLNDVFQVSELVRHQNPLTQSLVV